MDEEISLINTNTRNEKIKNFFINNKRLIISLLLLIVLLLMFFFGFNEFKKREKIDISNLYNSTIIKHSVDNKAETQESLIKIINKKDSTYSPLSLYFIIDNEIIKDKNEVNKLFDIIINKTSLENEIKNLIIYKKALFNADQSNENELLDILKPLINSESVWKSHALYLMAEFFYSKNEKQKSKEFFNQIIILDNANDDIARKAQKRLNRDLSE
jgi:predicted negative regulator of RcsB-dependent stress response|tara:strand:+ start:283 stop:927 length:645 start_codon:yes stop_codon:yes gene_type:complete